MAEPSAFDRLLPIRVVVDDDGNEYLAPRFRFAGSAVELSGSGATQEVVVTTPAGSFAPQAGTIAIATTGTAGTTNVGTRSTEVVTVGNSTGALSLAGSTAATNANTSITLRAPTIDINVAGAGGATNIGTRAGEDLIIGNATGTVEITGTLTNNGSPIGGGSYTAGDGLTLTGSDFDVDLADTTIFSDAGVASRALVLDGSSRVIATALRRTGGNLRVETITSGDLTMAVASSGGKVTLGVGGSAKEEITTSAGAIKKEQFDSATGATSCVNLYAPAGCSHAYVGTLAVTCATSLTETIGAASRTVTASSVNRTETYSGTVLLCASNSGGGQVGLARTGLNAQSDGTHQYWDYNGTVGLDLKVDPAGECDLGVAAGVTAYQIKKNGAIRLRITANGVSGGLATASGVQSFAFGDVLTVASGDSSIAMGYDAEALASYSIAIGAYLVSRAAASVQIGETLAHQTDSANSVQVGFTQSVGLNSPYVTLLGSYLNIGADCTGAHVCGLNASIPDGRPGQFTHSSGCTGYSGTQHIDMMRVCTAAPAALQNQQAGAFFPDVYSFGLYEITVIGCTDDAAIVAHEIIRIPIVSAVANLTLGTPVVVESTMAAAGWAVAVTEETAGELRITCDPDTDTVRFGATIAWRMIGATYAIP